VGLFDFGCKRETRHCNELREPWLVVLESGAEEEPVEVVDGEKCCEGGKGIVKIHFENPLHSLSARRSQRRVVEERGNVVKVFFGEKRTQLLGVPEEVLFEKSHIGEVWFCGGAIVNIFFSLFFFLPMNVVFRAEQGV